MPPTTTDISPDGPPLTRAGLQIDMREDAFSRYIGSLDFAVSNDLDRWVAHLDMAKGKGRITALLLVDRYPGLRPPRIAQVLLREGPAKGRITDDLVTSDDLRRDTDRGDLRAQSLCVTPKGQALAISVRRIIQEQERAFFDFIAPQDRAWFMRMLKRVYLNMRKKLE